jgi:hypothetical protein
MRHRIRFLSSFSRDRPLAVAQAEQESGRSKSMIFVAISWADWTIVETVYVERNGAVVCTVLGVAKDDQGIDAAGRSCLRQSEQPRDQHRRDSRYSRPRGMYDNRPHHRLDAIALKPVAQSDSPRTIGQPSRHPATTLRVLRMTRSSAQP